MDKSEKQVEAYLRHLGYQNMRFEPDGNVPPDFLVDASIAVEVRRLNQNYKTNGRSVGLEQVAIPLHRRMQKLVHDFGQSSPAKSWYLIYRFRRPLEDWKNISRKLTNILKETETTQPNTKTDHDLGNGFTVSLVPVPVPKATMFRIGIVSDHEAGGWVLEEMEKNLTLCIEEKTAKIQKVKSKYPEWWLIFVDHIGYGLEPDEWKLIRSRVLPPNDWQKIILVSPIDHTSAVTL